MIRRSYLAALGSLSSVALAGCSLASEAADRPNPPSYPEDPPRAAERTVKEFVRQVGRGNYRAACRDRCLLAASGGQRKLQAEPMSGGQLREWARGAEEWYGTADFRVDSVEVVGSKKMDPAAVGAQGFEAGYWIDLRYEGSGNIANPFRKGVVKDEGQWWILVGTF